MRVEIYASRRVRDENHTSLDEGGYWHCRVSKERYSFIAIHQTQTTYMIELMSAMILRKVPHALQLTEDAIGAYVGR